MLLLMDIDSVLIFSQLWFCSLHGVHHWALVRVPAGFFFHGFLVAHSFQDTYHMRRDGSAFLNRASGPELISCPIGYTTERVLWLCPLYSCSSRVNRRAFG